MKREDFEERYGKLPPGTTYLDLDARVARAPQEPVTAGWTDTQIRGKPLAEIDQMIASGEAGIDNLASMLQAERQRVDDLRLIRQRKIQLGG